MLTVHGLALQNQFPSREQRLELARVCNQAEVAMNNGSMVRGPEGDTEGITEQRVNTWFTNRRKGLTTPSPTRGKCERSGCEGGKCDGWSGGCEVVGTRGSRCEGWSWGQEQM